MDRRTGSTRMDPADAQAIGRAIKLLRSEQGIERKELAAEAGISYSYLAEIENGAKPPSSRVLYAIARVLALKTHQILETAERLRVQPRGQSLLTSHPPAPVAAAAPPPASERRWFRAAAATRGPVPEADSGGDVREELRRLIEGMSDEDVARLLDLARRLQR